MDGVKLKATDIERNSKQEIKRIFTDWNTEQWKQEIQSKSTLQIYRSHKEEEHVYDNIDLHLEYGLELEQTHYNSMIEIHSNKETNCLNCGHQSIL